MKKINLFYVLFFLIVNTMSAQIKRIEPPHWWVGFEHQNLQLLVQGDNIGKAEVDLKYPGLSIENIHQADSPNYLFLDLKIEKNAKAGQLKLKFKTKDGKFTYDYELKSRERSAEDYKGFDSSDVIYLITPDRFANANPDNDSFEYLKETGVNRNDDYARHGGDIQGIIEHLDYIDTMGFTAIWSSPLLTNDMPRASYHGYAITDFYQVDPRFGSLEDYKTLSQKANQRGIKIIMDMVANHCGSLHWWMKDLPFNDWINAQDAYENGKKIPTSNHRRTTNQDLYATDYDSQKMTEGWFVPSMPDLNQENPFLAQYIIQNSIWWIETLHLGGIRQDTYPYPDKYFMSKWAKAIMTEYPNFNIVGEEWSTNPLIVGYWQSGQNTPDGYQSHLKSSMDFPMQQTIVKALNQKETWGSGLDQIYEGLANDFYYPRPSDMLIFPDNHDMDRIFTQLNEDITKTKMALALILTMPRTPQIYYGTEILMQNTAKPGDHGLIRTDFPGGWANDEVDAFQNKGLTDEQQDFKSFLKTLLNFRKTSKAIHQGKTKHFAPFDNIYTLYRQYGDESVLLIISKNEEPIEINLKRFQELNLKEQKWTEIFGKNNLELSDKLTVKPGVNLFSNQN
ncbi:glycoside hydrolase family 13 protein [Flavobacterium sp. CS20]|uniref:glycoside hydrolase family 13 protein n=1 Tax=Flavobacterium sp. CS20 TaxID=2775246 RepID=UPI001B3A3F1D|nr:glycoside hydrolase family 13 protein [Flavobacterium sp. CS20]QTY27689.1 cyclomaltodextrinase N-terminal domain-containing protein [Flavobacterium sp. CS20]